MQKLLYPLAVIATIFLSAFSIYTSSTWKVADDYSIKFTSDDPSGIFKDLKGEIVFDENNLDASSFNMSINVKSINTGNGMKNKHAVGKKWFEADTYPKITFVGKKISKTDSAYEVLGTLALHGIEKEATIPFTFTNNTFTGSFVVNRTDFNLGPTKGMAGKASHEMKVDISVPVTK